VTVVGEGGPLAGVRVAVTRGEGQSAELCAGLAALGAELVVAPLIRIVPPLDPEPLRGAARGVEGYDWVVFTSANGVESFGEALAAERSTAAMAGVRVACIGPATAAAAERWGWRAALIPRSAVAESLLEALLRELRRGDGGGGVRVLLPVAAGARTVLEGGLAEAGIAVDRVEAYRTECDPGTARSLVERLAAGGIDLLTLASPSAVDCLADAAETMGVCIGRGCGTVVAVNGPITAAAARRRGFEVGIEAQEYTAAGLLRAIVGGRGAGFSRRISCGRPTPEC
jgi:uroporphyrinogen III methyltransferase/synthase